MSREVTTGEAGLIMATILILLIMVINVLQSNRIRELQIKVDGLEAGEIKTWKALSKQVEEDSKTLKSLILIRQDMEKLEQRTR